MFYSQDGVDNCDCLLYCVGMNLRIIGTLLFGGAIWMLAAQGSGIGALLLGIGGAYCLTMGREGTS